MSYCFACGLAFCGLCLDAGRDFHRHPLVICEPKANSTPATYVATFDANQPGLNTSTALSPGWQPNATANSAPDPPTTLWVVCSICSLGTFPAVSHSV